MPVIPDKTQKDRWIISYVIVIDGVKHHRKAEFIGTLKQALDQERNLRTYRKKSDVNADFEGAPNVSDDRS